MNALPFFKIKQLTLTFILTQAILSVGTTFERTIDDAAGDSVSGLLPVYTPTNGLSLGPNCAACVFHPDPANAFKGTWHDGTQLPGGPPVSVSLSFTGTSISLFCILANTASEGLATSDFSITLDGVSQGKFMHVPDNTSDFIYQAKVFSVDGLDRGFHQVVLATDNAAGSLMLFDYATYIFDDGVSSVSPVIDTTQVTNTVTSTAISTAQANSIQSSRNSQTTLFSGTFPLVTNAPSSSSVASISIGQSGSVDVTISSTLSPSSSTSSVTASASKRTQFVLVLAGTLIPITLIVLAAIMVYKRQRARYKKKFEETRVHLPGAEWVHFSESQADSPGTSGTHRIFNANGEKGRRIQQNAQPSPSVPGEPALSRAPTFRTFDPVARPPGYDFNFLPARLL
ncbi:hypothetical protein C8R44DRAFT_790719 [Mycena epipterygia]|nr:hypothetical protein C8R44DRAFT_790719 [Mycena epipterygia]